VALQRCIMGGHPIDPDKPRIVFAAKTFRRSNVLCWACYQEDVIGSGDDVTTWISEFIKRNTDPTVLLRNENQELKARLDRLQKLLDDEKKLNAQGRYK
jgi:hypothetical protein